MVKLPISRIILFSAIFSILVSLTSCPEGVQNHDKHDYVEAHRQLVLSELRNVLDDSDEIDKYLGFDANKLPLPDSLIGTSIGEYITEHPELPSYIRNALIKKIPVMLLSLEEFSLIYEKDINELVGRIGVNNEVEMYDRWIPDKSKLYLEGNGWIFRYGFLWDWGVV